MPSLKAVKLTCKGSYDHVVSNTLIHESPIMASVVTRDSDKPNGVKIEGVFEKVLILDKITAENLEETMRNVVVSISLVPTGSRVHLVKKKVNQTLLKDGYTLGNQSGFLGYVVPLAVSLSFIAGSFFVLCENGVSADSGFLQIVCTTSGAHGSMNLLAKQACLGGRADLPKELVDLEVRFGEIRGKQQIEGNETAPRMAGFGTLEETTLLRRGAQYG